MEIWQGTPHEWQQQILAAQDSRRRYVVTATNRLAQRLRDDIQEALHQVGASLIPAPEIMDYHSWLQHLWSMLSWRLPKPLSLLTDLQVQQVWRRVLLISDVDILNPLSVIQLAEQTYQTIRAYQLEEKDWQTFGTGDVRWFCQAYQAYQQQLVQHQFLDPADLPNILMEMKAHDFFQQVEIDWIGFVEYTPQQQTLIQYLSDSQRSFAQNRHIDWHMPSNVTNRVACVDTLDEFQQALTWAVDITQASKIAQVAIVVPKLQNSRLALLRETQRWQHQQVLPEISFSGGEPLADLPMFKSLFSALCLLQTPWQLTDILCLLRSNFMGEEPAGDALVGAIQALPEDLSTQLPACAMPEIFQQFLSEQGVTPAWLAVLRQHLYEVTEERSLPQWCDFAQTLLLRLRWPGHRLLNSTDYQALQKIMKLWSSMRMADPFDDSWTWSNFFLLLQQQAQQILFQPESPTCQIQVLGLWETVGQTFDGLWVMGLHQDAWPRPTRLSPFLPREVQLAHQLPGACPQREFDFARQMLQQWQQASLQLVCCFAEHEGAAHQSPSPLIVDFFSMNRQIPLVADACSFILENVVEQSMVEVSADENIRGGTAILAAQGQCSFQAFARFRLRVQPSDVDVVGFSAKQRGTLVHSCLEAFWRQHQHQAALKALSEEQLEKQLNEIIGTLLKSQHLKQSPMLNQALITAEQQRLLTLIKHWLEMEKWRTPFKVIALEQAIEVQLSQLQLLVRLDRLDQLETGEFVLMDYKTGAVNLQDWWHQPCLAPQLPLYALTVTPRADAIVYGVVTLPKPQLKGLGSAGLKVYDDAPRYLQKTVDTLEDWSDLQARWQQDIHQLALDFSRGIAHVQPINGDATCARCGLQSLCRVNSRF